MTVRFHSRRSVLQPVNLHHLESSPSSSCSVFAFLPLPSRHRLSHSFSEWSPPRLLHPLQHQDWCGALQRPLATSHDHQAKDVGIQHTSPPPSPNPPLWKAKGFTHGSGARHGARPTTPRPLQGSSPRCRR